MPGVKVFRTVLAGLALTATAAMGPASAQTLDKVAFGTNWVAEAEHGGFYQALVDGTYGRYGLDVTIVPGVSSICGAWGAAAAPMAWGDDALVVLPATLPLDELKRRLALADAAVIMKVGRNFARAKEALIATDMAERAIYVERATMAGEVVTPLCQKQDDSAPYFSLILAPGRGRRP